MPNNTFIKLFGNQGAAAGALQLSPAAGAPVVPLGLGETHESGIGIDSANIRRTGENTDGGQVTVGR